jgi:hypothetical protein
MNEIVTSALSVRQVGDRIEITHLKTGMSILVEIKKFERWAISQLRRELRPIPV